VRRDYLFYVSRREDGKHKEQSASEATEQAGVKECKLLTTLLLDGLGIFLTFWPLSRKLKEKFLCDPCDLSEAGGEPMPN